VVYVANAMAPEISPDGSAYHLGVVSRYLREGGFHRITTNMYANLSQGGEMLFVFAFAFGMHSAAALTHCAFLFALPLLMVCYGRRFGFPIAAVCGALLVALSPVIGSDGTSAYIDVALAAAAFALFYLLQIWDTSRDRSLWVPIGLLAGFLYALKYTGGLAVPYALGFVLWKSYRKRTPLLPPLAVIGTLAAAMMLPWMIKNWIWVGNPFSPLLNTVFPNPYVTIGFEQEYLQSLRHYDLASAREIPRAVTIRGSLGGLLGPVFLLSPVALFALIRRAGRQLLLAALVFGLPFVANIGCRFTIPALPFIGLAMALVLTNVPGLAPALIAIHAVLSWPGVIPRYADPGVWYLRHVPWKEALRIRPEERYLRANLQHYEVVRLIEQATPPGARVLTFTPIPEAYTTRDILVDYQSASNHQAGQILWNPLMPERAPTWQLVFRFAAQPLRGLRVLQTAAARDFWSVTEFRVFSSGRELERGQTWRLRAKPNPWDIPLAFDNSLVTYWSSAEPVRPGMFLEVDFGRSEIADSAVLVCSHDQWGVRLALEGHTAAGLWTPLGAGPEMHDLPPISLRRAAVDELKHRGIDYVLIFDSDFGAIDYKARAEEWGMVAVGETGGARLYRLS